MLKLGHLLDRAAFRPARLPDDLVTGIGTSEQVWFASVDATGTFGPSISETAHDWDAAIAAFER